MYRNPRNRIVRIFALSSAALALALAHGAPANAATDNSTMTIAAVNTGFGVWTGFDLGAFGSMSPATLASGKAYTQWWEYALGSTFEISGFTSDPGKSWLTSAICVGTTKTGASATYSYASGHAMWKWSSLFGFAAWLNAGHTTAPCSVVHN